MAREVGNNKPKKGWIENDWQSLKARRRLPAAKPPAPERPAVPTLGVGGDAPCSCMTAAGRAKRRVHSQRQQGPINRPPPTRDAVAERRAPISRASADHSPRSNILDKRYRSLSWGPGGVS